jgi:hypothetical protein
VPENTTLTTADGTPAAVCVRTTVAGFTVLNCTVNATLPVNETWVYSFPATTGNTTGSFVANVTLTQPDDNPTNNQDEAPLTVLPPILRDVAVNITATPDAGPLGSNFTFSINM